MRRAVGPVLCQRRVDVADRHQPDEVLDRLLGQAVGILAKPGALTEDEMALVRRHAAIGYDILRDSGMRERRCRRPSSAGRGP
jgi:hypothetical protein